MEYGASKSNIDLIAKKITKILHIFFAKMALLQFFIDIRKILCHKRNMFKLKDIATISSGVTFRSRIEASAHGNIRVIQMKDLGDDNFVHLKDTMRIESTQPNPNHLVELGDIIFRSRGQVNTAALLREYTDNTIVAAPLFRIRANKDKVIPEFLLWWINQRSSQAYFASISVGTMGQMVSLRGLADLEVMLPPLEQQNRIAQFFNLSMREQQLLDKIKKHKAIYVHGILMRMVIGSRLTVNREKLGYGAGASARVSIHSKARS